jgi:long-chain acyl-CoA synthetase
MNSIVESIKHFANVSPDKIAVIAEDEEITYSELYKKISAFAAHLVKRGIKVGDNVIIKGIPSIDFAVAVFGTHLCGAVNVPTEKTLGDDGLVAMIERMHAKLLVADEKPEGTDVDFIAKTDVREVPDCEYRGEMPTGDMLCDILFTTGSTGQSKGVMLSHRNIVAVSENMNHSINYLKDNVYMIAAPINHAAAIRKLYVSMFTGTTAVLFDGFMNLKGYFTYMEKYHVTSCHMPPSAIHMLVQLAAKKLSEFSDQLDHIHAGSAALPETDKEKISEILPDSRLIFAYGSSEAGCVSLYDFASYQGKINCVGKPNVNAEIFMVDDDKKPYKATKENPGRIAIKGDMVMQGYYKDEELTKTVIDENGVFYTSDLGYIDDEGFIYMVGRADDVINVGGLKIAPTEVEHEVLRMEGIVEAACFATDNKLTGKVPNLAVVMAEGYEFDGKAIAKFLFENLEAYKVPKNIFPVDEIPKKPNGKHDRTNFYKLAEK